MAERRKPIDRYTQVTADLKTLKDKIDKVMICEEVIELPSSSVSQLNKFVMQNNADGSKLYVCMRGLNGKYEWIQLAISNK